MADGKTAMVALNEGNYPTWKLQCKMALMKEGLWKIVIGKEFASTTTDVRRENTVSSSADEASDAAGAGQGGCEGSGAIPA